MASQLNNIRLKLEEKRRHIENEKRRMEVVMSKQRQKVGKAAFLQAVTKVKHPWDVSMCKLLRVGLCEIRTGHRCSPTRASSYRCRFDHRFITTYSHRIYVSPNVMVRKLEWLVSVIRRRRERATSEMSSTRDVAIRGAIVSRIVGCVVIETQH